MQFLGWIPEGIWESYAESRNGPRALDLLLLLWSVIVVGLAAIPIGLLTSCMCASQLLTLEGRQSTVIDCLKCVFPRIWPIWIFSWFDGWITADRVLERLPKKNDKTGLSQKAIEEIAYQGWKFASLSFIPALISGRSIKDACKDSVNVFINNFTALAKVRIGYSAICWIVRYRQLSFNI